MNGNSKRILCYNYIKNKKCNYGVKCKYAHNLSEQKIDPIRHKVYVMLKNNNNLRKINLTKDKKLFNTMNELTRICYQCIKNKCHGGLNCRNGAININYRICKNDLLYGNCKRLNCKSIHLTDRKLIPYYSQIRYNNKSSAKIDLDKINNTYGMDNMESEESGEDEEFLELLKKELEKLNI